MDQILFSRKELYQLVWKESMLSLSKRFDISDVGLRKICYRMGIPVPPVGYWTKIQFGKKVKRTKLTAKYKGEESVQLRVRDENSINNNAYTIRSTKILEIDNDSKIVLQVPEKLTKPNPLVLLSKRILSKEKPNTYDYLGTVSCSYEALNIRVDKSNVDRALILYDTLIKALVARGHVVIIKERKTIVIINEHEFEISLREKMRKEFVKGDFGLNQVFYPKGTLALKTDGVYGREYKDGNLKLEDQLSKIIAGLELSAEKRTQERLEFEKASAERNERVRLAIELDERKQQDLLSFKKLLTDSERWHKAENLRRFIQELEGKAAQNLKISSVSLEWLEWAKRKADWYDPFVESPDELLSDVDQNTLDLP